MCGSQAHAVVIQCGLEVRESQRLSVEGVVECAWSGMCNEWWWVLTRASWQLSAHQGVK